MAELKDSGLQRRANGHFTVDATYLRQQAGEAFWTFIAPLSGIYGAVVRDGHVQERASRLRPEERN